MSRISDEIKAVYEDETLGLFAAFRKEGGGPVYEFVAAGERPDRRIRVVGDSRIVGAEITRIVDPTDAALRGASYRMSHALVSLLAREEPGGVMELHAGDFPDTSRPAIEALATCLRTAIDHAGSVREFIDGLDGGFWDYGPEDTPSTRFYFKLARDPGWKTRSNGVAHPMRQSLPERELNQYLLARVRSKVAKAPGYEWEGPLLLLVRNTYQAFQPDATVLGSIRRLARGIFDEVWLVNHREGVVDLSPPRPRLVRID